MEDNEKAPPPHSQMVGSGPDQTDEEIRQWITACNHEPAKASLRHYLALRASAETEKNRLRRMVERRDEFIIANGLWDAFKEASREAE